MPRDSSFELSEGKKRVLANTNLKGSLLNQEKKQEHKQSRANLNQEDVFKMTRNLIENHLERIRDSKVNLLRRFEKNEGHTIKISEILND